jgi:hypothetical protein
MTIGGLPQAPVVDKSSISIVDVAFDKQDNAAR